MRTVKEDATRIADALANLEAATTIPDQGMWMRRLHRRLRAAVYRHAGQLGFSATDLDQLDNRGIILFGGGTPKTEPPTEGDDDDGD